MRLIATETLHYSQQTRQKGEEFDAEELHGKLLIQRGIARAMKAEEPSKPMTTQSASELVPPLNQTKRTYKRRDMSAED